MKIIAFLMIAGGLIILAKWRDSPPKNNEVVEGVSMYPSGGGIVYLDYSKAGVVSKTFGNATEAGGAGVTYIIEDQDPSPCPSEGGRGRPGFPQPEQIIRWKFEE